MDYKKACSIRYVKIRGKMFISPPTHVLEKLFDELLAVLEEDILEDTFQQKEYLH